MSNLGIKRRMQLLGRISLSLLFYQNLIDYFFSRLIFNFDIFIIFVCFCVKRVCLVYEQVFSQYVLAKGGSLKTLLSLFIQLVRGGGG